MNDIKEKILSYINIRLKSSLETNKVSEMYYKSTDCKGIDDYSDYSFEELIQLYKIDRLLELGVISEDVHHNLLELININKALIGKYTEQFFKDFEKVDLYDDYPKDWKSKKTIFLEKKLNEIAAIYDKYNLNITDFELKELIDFIIRNENHDDKNDEQLDIFIRAMKNNYKLK